MNVKIIVHRAPEGGYWAEVPSMPGCVSQGETLEDVQANLREAIEGWLLAGDEEIASAGGQVVELAVQPATRTRVSVSARPK